MNGFSIVVPTHGRAQMVERLLSSLQEARRRFKGESEVLVIDSSSPGEAEIIRQSCSRWQAQYCRAANSVARKRNIGIRRASRDIVFFTDSDCEADADALGEHWSIHEAGEPGVAGVLGLTEWSGRKGILWRVLDLSPSFSAAFSFAAWLRDAPWGTCTNLSVRRDALLAVDGFDESFPLKVYGEDVDLGLRLTKAAYGLRCNPRAKVLHSRESLTTLAAALRKSFTTGRADVYLGVRHPERLIVEFPPPLLTTALLFFVEAVRLLAGQSLWTLAAPFIWLGAFVLSQAILSALVEGDRLANLAFRVAAALPELAFEAGKTLESIRRGRVKRLWTKFVYVQEQLTAERQRRALQMWAMLFSFLLVAAFFR